MDINGLLDKYKNILVNTVVILLSLFVAFNFIYKKQKAQISSLNESKTMEEKKNILLDDISSLENKIDAYSHLLAKNDSGDVINTISNMAKMSGIKIVSIRPAQEQEHPDYVKSTFDLSVQADSYHSLGKFVSNVENYSSVYMVDLVDVRTNTTGEGLLVNLKISSIAYKKE